MSCSFAGGIDSPEDLWTFLMNGREAVGDVPADRWAPYAGQSWENAAVLRRTTGRGSYRPDISGFDADHFGISPREARLMDPQQRLALELAWEALEHAGVPVRDLAGSDTAVFVGIGTVDYGRRLLEDLPGIEAWTGIGASPCGAANRISHALDLRGPSVVIDTACSSSLVAIHHAVQGLLLEEFPLALVGGILLIAAPGFNVVLDAAGAISPDGRSKAFDAAADGYGRGEGGAFVVLKRLADAERDGDRVLAVIRGSAVHQDGRTQGIMAPSRPAQAHVMNRAYQAAGIDPATVSYVEAHGTGTPVGDVVEAGALSDVFGAGRPARGPCLIGSIKPNVGHLEAGSGVAGLVKVVQAMGHGEIPPTLVTTGPNPAIAWDANGLALVTAATKWPDNGHPRRAGVASYGYGGTLAHVVVEEGRAPSRHLRTGFPHADATSPMLFPVSGASEPSARANCLRLAGWLASHPEVDLADVGLTLARHRSHLEVRAAVVASDRSELEAGLRSPRLSSVGAGRKPVWVFSGHGAQWPGMGRGLLADEPAFAQVIDLLEPIYHEEMGFSLREALVEERLDDVGRIQAITVAIQIALAATWRAYGVRPAAVIGHSVGEIAAAVAAGVLEPLDGGRLACRRSRLLNRVAGRGAMAMVPLPFDEVAARLVGRRDLAAAIAASPMTTVVSGTPDAVSQITAALQAEGFGVRRIDSDVAFHSRQMEPLCPDLAASIRDIPSCHAVVPLYSTALVDPRDPARRDADYWVANLRDPVRFHGAIAAAAEDGHQLFLEISTHPVVAYSIADTAPDAVVVATLRRQKPERATLLEHLGALHCVGARVDWTAVHPEGHLVDLPTMAWQRRRHWLDQPQPPTGAAGSHDPSSHTLLGPSTTVHATTPLQLWRTRLDHASRPYPGEHSVLGTEVVPAAVLVHTFLAAAGGPAVRDVSLFVPLSTTPEREVEIVRQDGVLRLSSLVSGDWMTHATAIVDLETGPVPPGPSLEPPSGARNGSNAENANNGGNGTGTTDVGAGADDANFVIDRLAELGVPSMGFPWRITELHRGPATLSARVAADPDHALEHLSWAAVLDAVFSAASVVFPGPAVLRMPASVSQMRIGGDPPAEALVQVRLSGDECVDVDITTTEATPVGYLRGLRFGRPDGAPEIAGALAYEITWKPLAARTGHDAPPRTVAVIGDDADLSAMLAAAGLLCPGNEPDAVIVAPRPEPDDDPAETAMRLSNLLAEVIQTTDSARLWCVTRGAREPLDAAALSQTALWGLGRIAAGEHPERWGGLVDLPAQPEARDYRALLDLLSQRWEEDVMAIDAGEPSTARLVPSRAGRPGSLPACRPEGTYLVTGGTGALGLRVAHWLAGRGARRLVLIGRHRVASREAQDLRRSLESTGVTARLVAADVCDRDHLAELLDPDALGLPPIRGVVHAAGIVDNRFIRLLDEESLRQVMRPKVLGAMVLHDMFPPGSLDFFVLFSSAGQLLHLPGQAAYAAGNAFLDGLARHRRTGGHRESLSLAWTSWRGLGMSTSSAAIDAELRAHGTADITAAEALRTWEFADPSLAGNLAVLRVLPGYARTPLLRDLADEAGPTTVAWAQLSGPDRVDFLATEVRQAAAQALGADPDAVDVNRPLSDQGADSLVSVAIRSVLANRLGVALPATVLWNHPTVAAVAAYLADQGAPT